MGESEPMTEARISPDEAKTVVAFLRPSGAGNGGGNGDGADGRGGGGDGDGDHWMKIILERVREVYDRVERVLKKQNEVHLSSIKELAELIRETAAEMKTHALFAKTLAEQNLALAERVAVLERDLAARNSSDART